MPVAILPDISEQMCIGCALCVEICTTLGPDVLRVKPVEGWKRGKAFVFYPERCISDGACIGVCPTKAIFWMRPMDFTVGQPVPLYKNSVFVKGWTELIDKIHPFNFLLLFSNLILYYEIISLRYDYLW